VHFDKSMSSNLRENTFSAQLILAQRVLCAKAGKYNRAPNLLVLQCNEFISAAGNSIPCTSKAFYKLIWILKMTYIYRSPAHNLRKITICFVNITDFDLFYFYFVKKMERKVNGLFLCCRYKRVFVGPLYEWSGLHQHTWRLHL
jgi:hypothetical protein